MPRGKPTAQVTKRIWELYLAGMDRHEIAEQVGKSTASVSAAITRGRQVGVIPMPKPKPKQFRVKKLLHGNGLKVGNMGWMMDALSLEQIEWLVVDASRIGCDTLAEYITEIVRDEYERKRVERSGVGQS